MAENGREWEEEAFNILPARHASQSLDTAINIAFALQQITVRVLNDIALLVQIRQGARANLLCLEGNTLRLSQAV